MLLIQLFRMSKRRKTNLDKLSKSKNKENDIKQKYLERESSYLSTISKIEQDENSNKINKKKIKKSFMLPWWCKIIAYCISISIIGVSLFFILARGISFGDEKVRKWLTAFLTSIISSIFLTQPIKVRNDSYNAKPYHQRLFKKTLSKT